MKRRGVILGATAAFFALSLPAAASGWVEYREGVIENALASGKTVFVDYWASWCSTCRAQERRIEQLRGDDPAYDRAMTFVRVNWDDYARKPVTTSRNIPRRSTLLVLKGDRELGRIVAGTGTAQIRELMDKGL